MWRRCTTNAPILGGLRPACETDTCSSTYPARERERERERREEERVCRWGTRERWVSDDVTFSLAFSRLRTCVCARQATSVERGRGNLSNAHALSLSLSLSSLAFFFTHLQVHVRSLAQHLAQHLVLLNEPPAPGAVLLHPLLQRLLLLGGPLRIWRERSFFLG